MLGILGVLLVTAVLSVVFGLVALSQTRRDGTGGRGMAIAGVTLSGIWLAVVVVAGIVDSPANVERAADGEIAAGGPVSVVDIQVGDCLDDLPDAGRVFSVKAVPCDVLHDAEALATVELPAGDYPGPDAHDLAVEPCWDRVTDVIDDDELLDRLDLYTIAPTSSAWNSGDRTVLCIGAAVSGRLTEPIGAR